jgi:diguanylate cyclase (GGDEF)-like protein
MILVVMIVSRHGISVQSFEQKLFDAALIANALTLVFDAMVWVFNGTQAGGRALIVASVYGYYLLNPVITFVCLIYCDYKIFGSIRRLLARLPIFLVPLAVSYAVFYVNAFTGWFFTFDAANRYARGPAFLALPALMVIYPVWIEVLTLRYGRACKKETEREEIRLLSRYLFLPLAGLAIQLLTHGIQLVWIFSVLSFVMIYVNIQNRQIFTDELTGANNRRQIARAFSGMVESLNPSRRLYAVMIDADDFKRMNDSYGHAHGDELLIRMARMLEEICAPSGDFLARMGGDEFLILATREMGEEFGITRAIDNAIEYHNRVAEKKNMLSLSSGIAEFGSGKADTLDGLLSAADGAMYQNKLTRKAALRAAAG